MFQPPWSALTKLPVLISGYERDFCALTVPSNRNRWGWPRRSRTKGFRFPRRSTACLRRSNPQSVSPPSRSSPSVMVVTISGDHFWGISRAIGRTAYLQLLIQLREKCCLGVLNGRRAAGTGGDPATAAFGCRPIRRGLSGPRALPLKPLVEALCTPTRRWARRC